MSDIDLDMIRKRWASEASESDLGLWWLANHVREVLGEAAAEDEVRVTTLKGLSLLLESGELRAVNWVERWKGSEAWTGSVDQQLTRIEEGWKAVGKPDIGDVVWFVGRRR